MAKPKSPTARRVSAPRKIIAKAARRYRARRVNPDGGGDLIPSSGQLMATMVPVALGVGFYAGTRVMQRLAWNVCVKKRPTWAKHVHALAGVLTFGAVLIAGRKIRALSPYYEPALIGSGTAMVQGVVGAYIPRFAWLTGDPARAPQLVAGAPANGAPIAQGDYLEQQLQAFESPRRRANPVQQTLETAAAAAGDTGVDPTLMAELGQNEGVDDFYAGVFENPTTLEN